MEGRTYRNKRCCWIWATIFISEHSHLWLFLNFNRVFSLFTEYSQYSEYLEVLRPCPQETKVISVVQHVCVAVWSRGEPNTFSFSSDTSLRPTLIKTNSKTNSLRNTVSEKTPPKSSTASSSVCCSPESGESSAHIVLPSSLPPPPPLCLSESIKPCFSKAPAPCQKTFI